MACSRGVRGRGARAGRVSHLTFQAMDGGDGWHVERVLFYLSLEPHLVRHTGTVPGRFGPCVAQIGAPMLEK